MDFDKPSITRVDRSVEKDSDYSYNCPSIRIHIGRVFTEERNAIK